MASRTWRGLLGGSIAALLLLASTALTLAQTAPQLPDAPRPGTAPKPATTIAKSANPAVPAAAKQPAPAHATKNLASAKGKPPIKKLAAAPKKPTPAKKINVAAKQPMAPTRTAAIAPSPALPSYKVTSTSGNVTYTTTRIVPLQQTPATISAVTAEAKVAAVPVSLTQPIEIPASTPQKAAVATPEKTALRPADPKSAAAFVSNFLKDAFRLAKLSGATSLQRRAELADLFAGKMDVKRIAGYTTADELTGLSPEIQQRFRTILVSYLVETYYPQLELASDPSVVVGTTAAEPLADGTAVVWTTFTKDAWGSQSIKWHLAAEDGSYKIVDILSAGASLVQMERDTFRSVMRDGGLSQLMAKLDARTKELASAATE